VGVNRVYGWGFLFALRAAIYIYIVGGRLTPDSGLYARGRAWWSSPATAFAGHLAGYQGVCLAGIAGSFALGALVARNSHGILPPLAVALLPPGWYSMQPSADSSGAAACVYLTGKPWRNSFLLVVALFHLEASLVILGARVVGRWIAIRMDVLAIGMGALAQWHPTFHFQMRYFLPGLALLAIGRRNFAEDKRSDINSGPRSSNRILRDPIPRRNVLLELKP
jgi:hypothetical protein